MVKIGLVYNIMNEKAKESALITGEWLRRRSLSTVIYSNREVMKSGVESDLDFIVTFGGDGTVLRVANKVVRFNIPLLRVNFGDRGFMCNVAASEVQTALEKVLAGDYFIRKMVRIQAKIDEKRCRDSLNEIFVGGSYISTWLKVKINWEGRKRELYSVGNGLIFATPNGSTAWNNSAGGPQLLTNAFCVTASNARLKSESGWLLPTTKSLVVSLDAEFEVESLRWGRKHSPFVVYDTEEKKWKLKKEERVIISKSPFETLFVELNPPSRKASENKGGEK